MIFSEAERFRPSHAMSFAGRILRRLRLDGPLMVALLLLAGAGLFVLYSAGGQQVGQVIRQLIRVGVALTALLMVAQIPPKYLRMWSPWLYLAGMIMLILVLVMGASGKGAQRWLDLGLIRFQPAEIMKLAVPMMAAWVLHDRRLPPNAKDLLKLLVIILLPTILIATQPDLGTAALVGVSGLFVLFLGGLSWRLMGALALSIAGLAPLLWHFMHAYQKNRILMLFNPEADPLGNGWNIIQSKIAVGSGGLYGKGWLNGTQAHLEFLPERSTDFILAVYAEEFGLLGVICLFCLYLYIIGRSLSIATSAKDSYCRLLAGSLSLTFCIYVLVNGGMVSGLLPVVGVPLPLVSYGGTALVSLLASFGVIMSVYSHRKFLGGQGVP